jgi:predicted CoA-binding protein
MPGLREFSRAEVSPSNAARGERDAREKLCARLPFDPAEVAMPADAFVVAADDSAYLRGILQSARTIAVVGASPDPWRPSFGIVGYLKRAGYRVIPVNPTALGESVHGEPCRASLRDLGEDIDLVDVFRRLEFIPEVVEDAIAIHAPVLWLQLGIRHAEAARRAQAAGMKVVMDRCISIEHRRLMR